MTKQNALNLWEDIIVKSPELAGIAYYLDAYSDIEGNADEYVVNIAAFLTEWADALQTKEEK